MTEALLVIDYTESCCLEKYERPAWGCTFTAVREMAPRLSELVSSYRTHSIGQVIWIVCCPWIKGKVHLNIQNLYDANPESEFYTDGTGAGDFYHVSPINQERIFEKNLYSAFSGTNGELESYLASQEIRHLLISGVYSTGCVNATICEAFHRGFELSIVGDCVETFDRSASQDYQRILLKDWQSMYGDVVSTKDVIAM